jgi:CDP-6-deoxy-D-xylo-4-hexulose-3-dehydrase
MVLSRSKPEHDELYMLTNWGRKCICRPGYDNTCGKRFEDGYDCKYTFHRAGLNIKPLDLQGRVGLLQLDKQDRLSKIRKRNFDIVATYLDSVQDRVILP